MPRRSDPLTALAVKELKRPGLYFVGACKGLAIQVLPTGGKSWILRYMLDGKRRDMGLGSYADVTLERARELGQKARVLIKGDEEEGRPRIDPIEAKRARKLVAEAAAAKARVEDAKAITVKVAAARYIKAHSPTWKNPKHAQQWPSTLKTYVYPVIGDLPIREVDTPLILNVLEPIWAAKTETAKRVRGRLEAIIDWATASGFREGRGENPARWRGHLDKLLASPSAIRQVKNHASLPHAEMGAFWRALEGHDGASVEALRFTILTVARTAGTIGARWRDIDLVGKVWTIPAQEMKGKKYKTREHRVPLAPAAIEVLERMKGQRVDDDSFVFPGGKFGRPLSNMAMLMFVQTNLGREDLTVHGFRATFKTWASDRGRYPNEVVEAAMAHVNKDQSEAAYIRTDMLERRRRLMTAWATFCTKPEVVDAAGDNVHPIGQAAVAAA